MKMKGKDTFRQLGKIENGPVALNGKILLLKIIENIKIDAYFGQVRLCKV